VADLSPSRRRNTELVDAAFLWRKPIRWLAEAADALTSIFFAAGCRICDSLLVRASRVPICDECLASFLRLPEKQCEVCGQPLAGLTALEGQPLVCPICTNKVYAFDRARSFGVYEGALIRAILLLKFEQMAPLGAWFARQLDELVRCEPEILAADVVVPVPLHRRRERERGYNQAALIAKPLARRLKLPHKAILLTRTKA
jgi:predicted amidophosphoribosyltransferase